MFVAFIAGQAGGGGGGWSATSPREATRNNAEPRGRIVPLVNWIIRMEVLPWTAAVLFSGTSFALEGYGGNQHVRLSRLDLDRARRGRGIGSCRTHRGRRAPKPYSPPARAFRNRIRSSCVRDTQPYEG